MVTSMKVFKKEESLAQMRDNDKLCSHSSQVKWKDKAEKQNQTSVDLSFSATFLLNRPVLYAGSPARASHSAPAFLGATSHALCSSRHLNKTCVSLHPFILAVFSAWCRVAQWEEHQTTCQGTCL